ncbi:MAG: hypothetical protein AB8H12_05850 [Lewinella sp.]
MSKPNYYIGWLEELPERNSKAIRRLLIPVFVILPLIALAVVYFSEPFNDHQFDFGNVQSFTGTYHEMPFPVLILDEGQATDLPDDHLLLVGYGKNGATGFLQQAAEEKGALDGKHIRLAGTLIYGDGRALLELTDQEKSVLEVLPAPSSSSSAPATAPKKTELKGEILDPKCWFGVMKPAEGKVHKSCAIRCISGGIPPVLRVHTGEGNEYYVLKGAAGEDVNEQVLEFVGEPVIVRGEIYSQNGWMVMQTDPVTIAYETK